MNVVIRLELSPVCLFGFSFCPQCCGCVFTIQSFVVHNVTLDSSVASRAVAASVNLICQWSNAISVERTIMTQSAV